MECLDELGNMTSLEVLDLGNIILNGMLPETFRNMCKNVAMQPTHSKPDDLDRVNPKIYLASTQERSVSGPKACQSI